MNATVDMRLNTLFVKVERVLLENSSLKNEKIILENEILELKSQLLSVKNDQLDLQNENSTLRSTIDIQRNTLNELKEQNKIIKLAKEMSPDSSDSHELKIKINELVRDIDRCIDLLNE
jgi:predicted  nucleic acid-binding Zn-ribbon protein